MKQLKITDGIVLLDDEDYAWVSKHHWAVNNSGYACLVLSGKKYLLMHRAIIKAKDCQIVDHINGNKLDNRKGNLRFCTLSQNQMNSGKQKNNKSGYKGVYLFRNKWNAVITVDKKSKYIGRFNTPQEAALAYNQKAIELHGEYARLNGGVNHG